MKKFLAIASTAALSTLAFAAFTTSASAECLQEGSCFDSYHGVTLGGSANFGGFGAGVFNGEDGGILINKEGGGSTNLTLDVAGNLCGIDCQDGSFTFNAKAYEIISVMAGASGQTSGETVSVLNEGGVFTRADFDFGKINVTNNPD